MKDFLGQTITAGDYILICGDHKFIPAKVEYLNNNFIVTSGGRVIKHYATQTVKVVLEKGTRELIELDRKVKDDL